jgi:2-phosphosulfolactate phosphatase
MFIDLIFSPDEITRYNDLSNKTSIAIDVLRATTTMLYAFSGFDNEDKSKLKGVKEIIPVKDVQTALDLYKTLNDNNYLLAGEKNGYAPEGFHLGNSPADFLISKISGKSLIKATTNGTRIITLLKNSQNLFAASFLNAFTIARKCIELKNDLIIGCAGTRNFPGLEDIACGGLITSYIIDLAMEKAIPIEFSDSTLIALKTYQSFGSVQEILEKSKHGQTLKRIGLEKDLQYCSEKNKFNILPKLCGDKITAEVLDNVTFCSLYN